MSQPEKPRVTFGEIFDRVGIAAVCIVGIYVGRRIEIAVETLDEHRLQIAIIQTERKSQSEKDKEQDSRLREIEEVLFPKPRRGR